MCKLIVSVSLGEAIFESINSLNLHLKRLRDAKSIRKQNTYSIQQYQHQQINK